MVTSTEAEQWKGRYNDIVRDVQHYQLVQEAQGAQAKTHRFRRVLLADLWQYLLRFKMYIVRAYETRLELKRLSIFSHILIRKCLSELVLPQGAILVPKGLRLPPYLRIILMVLTANVVLVMGWLVLVRSDTFPRDPFSSHEDIFIGQSKSVLVAQGYSCQPGPISHSEYCSSQPWTGPFSYIGALMVDNRVNWLDFILRDNALKIGDLILLWGMPHSMQINPTLRRLSWRTDDPMMFSLPYNQPLNYLRPVRSVSFALNRRALAYDSPS